MRRILRPVREDEWADAMRLVWRVFLKFEADTYSLEGINNFYRFITDQVLFKMFRMKEYRLFGCFDDDVPRGVISCRDRNHISLLFVEEAFQHQGIARALMRYLCDFLLEQMGETWVTVNSSPYAVGFYHRMGFEDTGPEQTRNGITFTPMRFCL